MFSKSIAVNLIVMLINNHKVLAKSDLTMNDLKENLTNELVVDETDRWDTVSYIGRYFRAIQDESMKNIFGAMKTTGEHKRVKRLVPGVHPEEKVFVVSTDLPKLFKMAVRVLYDTYRATWFSMKPTPLKFTIIPPIKYFFNTQKNFV